MKTSTALHLALDDLIADLRHARRIGDLGRLALVAYCEVRPWARKAGESELAELLSDIMTHSPHTSRASFLDHIDQLIFELLRIHGEAEVVDVGAVADRSDDLQARAQQSIEGLAVDGPPASECAEGLLSRSVRLSSL